MAFIQDVRGRGHLTQEEQAIVTWLLRRTRYLGIQNSDLVQSKAQYLDLHPFWATPVILKQIPSLVFEKCWIENLKWISIANHNGKTSESRSGTFKSILQPVIPIWDSLMMYLRKRLPLSGREISSPGVFEMITNFTL